MSSEQFIAYRLSDQLLASPITAVDEVTDPLPVNAVGGTLRWFQGVATKKGQLLPVTDLGDYASLGPSHKQPQSKLLLVSHFGETFGLTVDEVMGLTDADDRSTETDPDDPLADTLLAPLRDGRVLVEGQWLTVVDLPKLLEQDQFIAVGLKA